MPSSKSKYAPLSATALERLEPYRDLMGKRPDGEIANLAGLDRRYVVVFRIQHDIPPYRRSNTPKPAPAAASKALGFRKSKLDEFRHLMGDVPDGRIAELAGCSREAVMRYRKRHDISAAPRGRKDEELETTPVQPVVEPVVEVVVEPVVEVVVEPVVEAVIETVVEPVEPPQVDDDLPPEVDEVMMAAQAAAAPDAQPVEHEGYVITVREDDADKDWFILSTDIAAAARKAMALVAREQPGGQIVALRYCADLV